MIPCIRHETPATCGTTVILLHPPAPRRVTCRLYSHGAGRNNSEEIGRPLSSAGHATTSNPAKWGRGGGGGGGGTPPPPTRGAGRDLALPTLHLPFAAPIT